MSLLRYGLRLHISPAASRLFPTVTTTKLVQRTYASKKPKHGSNSERATPSGSKREPITTTSLTPGSQQALSDPAAREEHTRASAAMSSSVEWFRREVAQLDMRASGRVTPQLLDSVRVSLHNEEGPSVRLEELATVGVRDGSSLVVTVFEPQVRLTSSLSLFLQFVADELQSLALVESKTRTRRHIRLQDTRHHPPARRRAHAEDTHTEVRFRSSLSLISLDSDGSVLSDQRWKRASPPIQPRRSKPRMRVCRSAASIRPA